MALTFFCCSAFCNYTDLEAFTEEKKRSLLAKRHGKGADFLRAVDEIIEVFDSLKEKDKNKLELADDEVKPVVEKLAENNSGIDTENLVNGSNTHSGKMIEHFITTRNPDMVNSDGPSVTVKGDEPCVVNSAPDEPTENVAILDEMRDIPLCPNSFSNKPRDAEPQNCYTRSRVPSLRKSRSSISVESRKAQGSGKLLDCQSHTEDDKANSGAISTSDTVLLHSSIGTFNKSVALETISSKRKLNSPVKVDSTCNSEASENGASETELKSNGTSNLPMDTAVIFKRKRNVDRKPVTHYKDCTPPNKGEELQAEYSEILPDSPNSKNEVNKSDGDEHLPLVKRARVRMGRSQLEDSPIDDIDVSNKKPEIAITADKCDTHYTPALPIKDYSADQVAAVVNTVSNPSSKFDMPILSREGHPSWKNKEYHPKILALDVEAALPPSKRLHRALEAMSANVAETNNSIPEVTGHSDMVLDGSLSMGNNHSNISADAVVTVSNKPGIVQSPGPSLDTEFVHSPSGKYTSESIFQNNAVSDSASVPSKANNHDNHIMTKGDICEETHMDSKAVNCSLVCNELDNDVCGKTSALCMKSNEPALDATQTTSVPDRLSSSLEKASENVVTIDVKETRAFGSAACDVDGTDKPVDHASNNVITNAICHGEIVIAESVNNVGDTASNSSLATKSSSIQSDADTRTSEV